MGHPEHVRRSSPPALSHGRGANQEQEERRGDFEALRDRFG
jgi:hypothetical protein